MGYRRLCSAFPPWTPRGWRGNLEPEETPGEGRGGGAFLRRENAGLQRVGTEGGASSPFPHPPGSWLPQAPRERARSIPRRPQLLMASLTPMGVLAVIVGNVVPGGQARTRSQTTIPNRPRASGVASRRVFAGGGAAAGWGVPNGSCGGLTSGQLGFASFLRGVSGVPRLGSGRGSEVSERSGDRGVRRRRWVSLTTMTWVVSDCPWRVETRLPEGVLFLSLSVRSDAFRLVLALAAHAALQGCILVDEKSERKLSCFPPLLPDERRANSVKLGVLGTRQYYIKP